MFKPKNNQQQPFYLSWFSQQGDLKRGGTAPHESRKERLTFKSPYQQPLTTLVQMSVGPQPKNNSQIRSNYQNNIQQISKIYANPPKHFMSKQRKSLEINKMQDKSVKRAFTQQNQRPKLHQEIRPNTQQQCELIYMTDDEQELTPREDALQYQEPYQVQKSDSSLDKYLDNDDSNKSQEAESENNKSIPDQAPDSQQNRSFFQDEILSNRKTTATYHPTSMNRPMTSEGGRRRKFLNSHPDVSDKVFEESEDQVTSMRSNQRRKQTDNTQFNRPPSRHKTPPKATDLEIPQIDTEEIPIKNMYAQIDKPSDQDSFEMEYVNNKINANAFQEQKDTKLFACTEISNTNGRHPQSAHLKYQSPKFANMSYSPLNSSKFQSNRDNFADIIIKHNTSAALHRPSNQPVKVPFKTSLGQDFLRLFANNIN